VGPALSPAVHGTQRFFRSVLVLHTGGQVIGGLALGLIAGVLGIAVHASGAPGLLSVGLAISAYSVSDLLSWRIWHPSSTWQVPEHFRRTPHVRAMAFLWGLELGFGWLTKTRAAFVVGFLGMVISSAAVALIAGATFGLARGMTVLVGVGTQDFDQVLDRFSAVQNAVRRLAAVTAALGMALAALIVSTVV
jgi:hypothetical protein